AVAVPCITYAVVGTMLSALPFPSAPRLPDDLTELDQWLLWRFENVGGREAKVPYSVRGHRASSIDARTWATFDLALRAWCRDRREYVGLGFAFVKGGGLVGIDLDDCLTPKGELKSWARGIVE